MAVRAERVGFEPTRRLDTAYAISNPNEYVPIRIAVSNNCAVLQAFYRTVQSSSSGTYRLMPARLQYFRSRYWASGMRLPTSDKERAKPE